MTVKPNRAIMAAQIRAAILAHGLSISEIIPDFPGVVKKSDYDKLLDLLFILLADVDNDLINERVKKWMEENFNDNDTRS